MRSPRRARIGKQDWPTLLIITNIWTPYRAAFFDVLDEECRHSSIQLEVLLVAHTEKGRPWTFPQESAPHWARVLPGIHPRFGGVTFHMNPGVVAAIRQGPPTWVVSGGSWLTPTMLLGRLARSSRSWCILWSEGHADAAIVPSGPIASLRRATLRTYDGFAAPNQRSATYLREQTGRSSPVLSLPNTVDESTFREETRAEARDVVVDKRPKPITLLVVARLKSIKRVREAVEAFLRLPSHLRQASQLLVAGDGPERDAIEQLAKSEPNIKLLGQVHTDRMPSLYRDVDGFALLSSRDPNPLSVIEASFASLPLMLSTEVGNCRELAVPGLNGWIVDMNDSRMLDQAFAEFFGSPRLALIEMGRASQEIAERSFTRRQVASTFLSELTSAFPAGERIFRGMRK